MEVVENEKNTPKNAGGLVRESSAGSGVPVGVLHTAPTFCPLCVLHSSQTCSTLYTYSGVGVSVLLLTG